MQKLKDFLEATVIKYLRQAGVAAFIVIGLYLAYTSRIADRNATIEDDKVRLEKCEANNIALNSVIAIKDSLILANASDKLKDAIDAKQVLENIILTFKNR